MVKTFGLLAFGVLLFGLAFLGLCLPGRLKAMALKAVNWGATSRIRLISSYMRGVARHVDSSGYRISLRIFGALCLLFAGFVIWMFIRTVRGID